MKHTKRTIGSLAIWLIAATAGLTVSCAASQDSSPLLRPSIQRRAGRLLTDRLPTLHLRPPALDEALAAKAFEGYIEQLDRNRYFFLASDIEEMRTEAPPVFEALRGGDLAFARRVFERFRERVADRVAFAEWEMADGPPEVDADEFLWRRRKAPWPEDRDAWDELWRLRLKNEWLSRTVALRLAEEERDEAGETPEEDEELSDPHLSPEEFVVNRHRQFLGMLQDSDDLWFIERYFNSFTQAMDPHSEYLSPSRSEDFDINMRLSLYGIGALLSTEDGAARVMRILPGGPAERDGRLQPGDRIVAVGQNDEEPVEVLHWPLYRVVRLIRGEKGTRVVLVIWPASDISGATERRIDLVRDEVRLEERAARSSVFAIAGADEVKRKLGVITLPDFYADFRGDAEARRSGRDVLRHIEELKDAGIEGMVLDLRNNGGGSLADAIEIAGFFIESGPVVQVRDRRGVHVLNDPDPSRSYAGPLVVLVNRLSASASEIVAAALQDYRRALIVGDSKTHGKGTVQTLMPLDRRQPGIGSLKVTTAGFYRIAGGSTQVRGVVPDVVVPSPLDAMEIGEEFLPNALSWSAVPAAFYATMDGDVPPLELVRDFSRVRREEDPRHREREELIADMAERQAQERLSLDADVRLEQLRKERALDDWRRRFPDGGDDEDADEAEPDLVLDEALRVLADTVAWRHSAQKENQDAAARTLRIPVGSLESR